LGCDVWLNDIWDDTWRLLRGVGAFLFVYFLYLLEMLKRVGGYWVVIKHIIHTPHFAVHVEVFIADDVLFMCLCAI